MQDFERQVCRLDDRPGGQGRHQADQGWILGSPHFGQVCQLDEFIGPGLTEVPAAIVEPYLQPFMGDRLFQDKIRRPIPVHVKRPDSQGAVI